MLEHFDMIRPEDEDEDEWEHVWQIRGKQMGGGRAEE